MQRPEMPTANLLHPPWHVVIHPERAPYNTSTALCDHGCGEGGPPGDDPSRTPYLLRSSGDSAADMILRRSLEGALKCALRHLRRDDVTRSEYFMVLRHPGKPCRQPAAHSREPCADKPNPIAMGLPNTFARASRARTCRKHAVDSWRRSGLARARRGCTFPPALVDRRTAEQPFDASRPSLRTTTL